MLGQAPASGTAREPQSATALASALAVRARVEPWPEGRCPELAAYDQWTPPSGPTAGRSSAARPPRPLGRLAAKAVFRAAVAPVYEPAVRRLATEEPAVRRLATEEPADSQPETSRPADSEASQAVESGAGDPAPAEQPEQPSRSQTGRSSYRNRTARTASPCAAEVQADPTRVPQLRLPGAQLARRDPLDCSESWDEAGFERQHLGSD